mmetsp:Transcript_13545/g.33249  ORF Transcript_13545/g.33249 Transcript_13545/m.33249 type:complete len:253 (-) Transcript_13545:375-1133(-)
MWQVRHTRRGGQQLKHVLHVYQRLLHLSVVRPKVRERYVQLVHEGDEQHRVTHGQRACHHAPHAHHAASHQTHPHHTALHNRQQRQEGQLPVLGGLVRARGAVKLRELQRLGAKQLHGLVVEQHVGGARLARVVQRVHALAHLAAPLGDDHGEGDVRRDRDAHDDGRPRLHVRHQVHARHRDVGHLGQHVEQHDGHRVLDGGRAPVQDAHDGACLAFDVEGVVQRQQVPHHVQAHTPEGGLRDGRPQNVAHG